MPNYDLFSSATNKDELTCIFCKAIFENTGFYFFIDKKAFEIMQDNLYDHFFYDNFFASIDANCDDTNADTITLIQLSTNRTLTLKQCSSAIGELTEEDGLDYEDYPDTLEKTPEEFQAILINLFN